MKARCPLCEQGWRRQDQEHWEHREHHQNEHHRLRMGQRFRRFCGANLRRRMFIWFGATIFVTALVNIALARLALSSHFRGRIPPVLFLIVPLVVLWAASGKVARRIARPLGALVDVAREIGAGRLGARARLPRRGIDEIAELSRAINDMAARIERQIADQRELLAGVSHEIRTPLARLRVLVEIGREQGAQAMNLDHVEREVIEIDALVGDLLASARLDFSALSFVSIDAVALARDALTRAGVGVERMSVVPSHGATATGSGTGTGTANTTAGTATGGGPSLKFRGDPTLLSRALANLLRNAAVHGGGVDRVVIFEDERSITFVVQDRGPGFVPGEERRVFERFYRPQPRHQSQQHRGETPAQTDGAHPDSAAGLGLGLALVMRIAEAHAGQVIARNRSERGGAEVSLTLPRAIQFVSPPSMTT